MQIEKQTNVFSIFLHLKKGLEMQMFHVEEESLKLIFKELLNTWLINAFSYIFMILSKIMI